MNDGYVFLWQSCKELKYMSKVAIFKYLLDDLFQKFWELMGCCSLGELVVLLNGSNIILSCTLACGLVWRLAAWWSVFLSANDLDWWIWVSLMTATFLRHCYPNWGQGQSCWRSEVEVKDVCPLHEYLRGHIHMLREWACALFSESLHKVQQGRDAQCHLILVHWARLSYLCRLQSFVKAALNTRVVIYLLGGIAHSIEETELKQGTFLQGSSILVGFHSMQSPGL